MCCVVILDGYNLIEILKHWIKSIAWRLKSYSEFNKSHIDHSVIKILRLCLCTIYKAIDMERSFNYLQIRLRANMHSFWVNKLEFYLYNSVFGSCKAKNVSGSLVMYQSIWWLGGCSSKKLGYEPTKFRQFLRL